MYVCFDLFCAQIIPISSLFAVFMLYVGIYMIFFVLIQEIKNKYFRLRRTREVKKFVTFVIGPSYTNVNIVIYLSKKTY